MTKLSIASLKAHIGIKKKTHIDIINNNCKVHFCEWYKITTPPALLIVLNCVHIDNEFIGSPVLLTSVFLYSEYNAYVSCFGLLHVIPLILEIYFLRLWYLSNIYQTGQHGRY